MTAPDLPYDYEDFGLNEDALRDKYDWEHPEYTRTAWLEAHTGNLITAPAYWTWVIRKIATDD